MYVQLHVNQEPTCQRTNVHRQLTQCGKLCDSPRQTRRQPLSPSKNPDCGWAQHHSPLLCHLATTHVFVQSRGNPYQVPHTNQSSYEEAGHHQQDPCSMDGYLRHEPYGAGVIILVNIDMTPSIKIGIRSRKILTSMNNYTHHIYSPIPGWDRECNNTRFVKETFTSSSRVSVSRRSVFVGTVTKNPTHRVVSLCFFIFYF